jgi:hypothetical protein
MRGLQLYIPTRGRVNMQLTLKNMPEKWRERTTLVCPKEEATKHMINWPDVICVVQPDPKMTIAQKRKWIFETAAKRKHEKIMMLDDDLSFCPRYEHPKEFEGYQEKVSGTWKKYLQEHPEAAGLYKCSDPNDPKIDLAFTRIEQMLDDYHHGGLGPRLMNNNLPGEFMLNKRAIYATAYRVSTVLKHATLGRIETREDIDLTLQLLKKGFENAIYVWCPVEQYELYGAEGGASLERTMVGSNKDAYKLAKLHPGLVKVVKKDYLVSTPRYEVVCQWEKAAQLGKNEFLGGV